MSPRTLRRVHQIVLGLAMALAFILAAQSIRVVDGDVRIELASPSAEDKADR